MSGQGPGPGRTLAWIAIGALLCSSCERRPVDTGSVITANVVGSTHLQEGRLAEAEAEFRKVISLAPWLGTGYANLALVDLRRGQYDDAQKQLQKAIARDTANALFRLWLARVHELAGRPAQARDELERLVARDSSNLRALYALARLDTAVTRGAERDAYLARIAALAPTNLAVRLEQAFRLLARGQADSVVAALEELRRIEPEPPVEARGAFEEALTALRGGRLDAADSALQRYRRFVELSTAYQAGLRALAGPEGPQAGLPTLTFSPVLQLAGDDVARAVRDAITFSEATDEAGLGGAGSPAGGPRTGSATLALGDYDGDGMDDLLDASGVSSIRLFRSDSGRFHDATDRAGLTGVTATKAAFGDVDNDGRMDLFLADAGSARLFVSTDRGRFREARPLPVPGGVRRAVFVDADHDGDLDLVVATDRGVTLLRNNLDGTFADVTEQAGLGRSAPGRDIAFGDLDDDGRVDLILVTDAGGAVYRNRGQQVFEDVSAAVGLVPDPGFHAIATDDYDNDGYLDLVLAGEAGVAFYRNRGDGTFARDRRPDDAALGVRDVQSVTLLDYDNDGWLDLAVTGGGSGGAAGAGQLVRLFANDGGGRFEDRSSALPADIGGGAALLTSDYDDDGDVDLLFGTTAGTRVLRNDGGNTNRYVQLRLTALRTGSGKNNTFGIGARVELRAEDLYQVRVVTDRVTHFGLGNRPSASALRVVWPNGVPQVLARSVSTAEVEEDLLKGSCAFVYGWNGGSFELVTDMMWRSALGMPLGIMGGTAAYAPPGASLEYLRIPGDRLQPRDGRYLLQVTEELWETAYLDEIRLLAVDHPDSVEVHVNERFVPPAPTPLVLYALTRLAPPVAATDGHGTDQLPALRNRDDRYVAGFTPLRYQGLTEPHDLILDLGADLPPEGVLLVLNGWIYPTDASINVALSQSDAIVPRPPTLEARSPGGPWRTVLSDLGFPAGKRKTVIADLRGRLRPGEREVRIRTNLAIYWDQARVGVERPATPVRVTRLAPVEADLHYRGFSREYRKGGRYGPHWFDYDDVTTAPRWRPIAGRFTRHGDVLPLVTASDDRYVVMAPGDEVTIAFPDGELPPLPAGWTRDFLLYSDGWIKDSDLNTATGTTVEPLPFHAMPRYPYGPDEPVPDDSAARRYRAEYNTRAAPPTGLP